MLTGSQQFLLTERITQSLAGLAAVMDLLPFSIAELAGRTGVGADEIERRRPIERAVGTLSLDDALFTGSFPPIHDRGLEPGPWLDAYMRTYVERDVRLVANLGDLDKFGRFVGLCAGRAGQILDYSSLGHDAGITHPTAKRWSTTPRLPGSVAGSSYRVATSGTRRSDSRYGRGGR